MASFTTDPAVLNEKATKLNQFAEEYDSIRAQLRQSATSMGAAYDSDDNRAFTVRIEEFCVDLQGMSDKLRTAAQTLNQQAGLYTSQEAENRDWARRLPGNR